MRNLEEVIKGRIADLKRTNKQILKDIGSRITIADSTIISEAKNLNENGIRIMELELMLNQIK